MEVTPNIDLSSVIVSVATAITEANRILNEGAEAPLGISECTVQYRVHASLHVREAAASAQKFRLAESGMMVLEKPQLRSAQLRNLTMMTPKERILTGYTQDADLTITTKFEPLPKLG